MAAQKGERILQLQQLYVDSEAALLPGGQARQKYLQQLDSVGGEKGIECGNSFCSLLLHGARSFPDKNSIFYVDRAAFMCGRRPMKWMRLLRGASRGRPPGKVS